MSDPQFTAASYDALSKPPTALTHEFSDRWYRDVPPPEHGKIPVEMPFFGEVDGQLTNQFQIAYTRWGDRGPWILFLHGVPTNRSQYYATQKRLSPFCRTVSIDMLGMGESSMPLNYGQRMVDPNANLNYQWVYHRLQQGNKPWDWVFDSIYLVQVANKLFGEEKFFFVADDWGGGILSHFAALTGDVTLGNIWIDPIAFDGYPVSEIQAFGRASQLMGEEFVKAMGSADQTMVQIFKTMTFDPNVWNQYSLRDIKKTYIDVDYERSASSSSQGEDATSLTLRLHPVQMKVLTDRAAILSPALLLPYHPTKNPKGVDYTRIKSPGKVIWGKQDNMMPERQLWRFVHVMNNAEVTVDSIDNAGHFANLDRPDAVAESIMGFILSKPEWRKMVGDVFVGLGGKHSIYKGDEVEVVKAYRQIYNI